MELQLSLFNDEILGVPNQDTFINSELEQLQLSPTWEKLATKPPAQTSTQELTLSLYPETNKIRPERVGSQKRGFDREKDLSTSNDVVPSASLLATPTTAFAVGGNVLQVTTTADENDGGLGGSGLSLRDAVLYALANPNEDFRIQLQAGETYTLTLDGRNEYKSLTGDLNVKGINLIIETIGGKDQATIDGNGLDRIFQVKDASLTLDNIKVTRGKNDSSYPAGQGGGISSSHSTLNLINSTITKNAGRLGGGIYSINSEIYLDNSEITDNTSKYDKGAGIYAKETGSNQAIVKLENSFIARNTADVGGVITAIGGVAIEVLNSTFEDNFGSSPEGVTSKLKALLSKAFSNLG